MTELSRVHPDRDAIVAQLALILQNKNAWKDRVASSTGQTLIDLVGAIGAYSQYSIESSYQEVWPESAKNKESQYAAANYAGVRYNRKAPASITVQLKSVAPMTVPPYTQWSVGGTTWFNRDPISVTTGNTNHTLYQGQMVRSVVNGLGTDFQAYISPEGNFKVSDVDVRVKMNGGQLNCQRGGLWTLKGMPGCQDLSVPSGQLFILFGNDHYGTKPGVNDELEIIYPVTFGADGNNLVVQGKKVATDYSASISGTATSTASGGGNEQDPFVFKNVTPALWGAFDSSVTPPQYKRLPLTYPGVVDAQTFSQREINPKALTWMNNVRVVILPTGPLWNDAQFDTFVNWMNERTMYKSHYVRKDPVAVNTTVNIDVYCSNFSNLTEVKAKVEAKLQALFAPREGILGFDFYRHDIDVAAHAADSNVEYVVINAPTSDIVLSSLNVKAPTLTRLTGGTLPSGVYDYGVSVVSALGGETAPANWRSITVTTGSNRIMVEWEPVVNALQYRIWGRITGNNLGLIATVAGTATSYIDTGSVTPTGLVPVEATVASYYAKLTSLTVNMHYSTRPKKLEPHQG